MNKIIIPTGYMGSGSSAVTDLLCEVEGYSARHGSYEYVFMHCPNGIFDLEDKLTEGNNTTRSDEALHSFYYSMKELYSERTWWFADYKHKISPNFMRYCNEYIEDLIDVKMPDNFWYYQERIPGPNRFQRLINRIMSKIFRRKISVERKMLYKGMWIAYPTKQVFYNKTKKFLKKIFISLGIEKENIILDQLILSHNVHRVDNYFDDNCKVIVVDRDPRDAYILNKYFWKQLNTPVPFPYDVESFCLYYENMRKSEKIVPNNMVLRIHFEDLIYHYEDTKKIIFDFVGINECDHKKQFTRLIPEKSMLNTQLYNRDDKYTEEAKYIEKHLNKYIYSFPVDRYERIYDKDVIL